MSEEAMPVKEKKNCECEFCVRTRAFEHQLTMIDNPDIRKWFESFYEYVMGIEEDLSCEQVYMQNLKKLYPRIWKEVRTIKPLEKDDAQFPEKQI